MTILALIDRVIELRARGSRLRACLVIGSRGSTPQGTGALMLVDDATQSHGTIGGGCVEAEVRRRAFEMLASDLCGTLTFRLDHDYGWDDGLLCGGTLSVAVGTLPDDEVLTAIRDEVAQRRPATLRITTHDEMGAECAHELPIDPPPRLYIAGAGHVGAALARQADALGFDVRLFDDRADLLEHNCPEGCAATAGEIADHLRDAPVDDLTYCVIVTRGHRHDAQALSAVVGRGAAYVGMIGSRRKVKVIYDDLLSRGTPESDLAGVFAPIGLDIGSETVEEIALSISAQLVRVRRLKATPPRTLPAVPTSLEPASDR